MDVPVARCIRAPRFLLTLPARPVGLKDTTLPEPSTAGAGGVDTLAEFSVAVVYCAGCASGDRAIAIRGPTTFGRDDECSVVLDDPTVSRAHARFDLGVGDLLVTDLGSQNGTYVDGERVADSAPARVGSVVRLSGVLLVVTKRARVPPPPPPRAPGLVGGPALDELRRRIATVARSRTPVLIEGESGSGKEVVARAVHAASERAGELVAVNSAAIPEELVEAELFGHARGAFSGALGARPGLFRAADRGTLFLDEVGELGPAVQAKLLRVLETGEVRAVGDDRAVQTDVRVVCATHRNLSALVAAGGFRADLFHRVSALRLLVPPLSAHNEDIALLCEAFLAGSGVEMSALVLEQLLRRPWPGNVRELKHCVEGAAATARFAGREMIALADLPPASLLPVPALPEPLRNDDERARIEAALSAHRGAVAHAAAALGVSRTTLYESIRRLKLDPSAYRRQ